MSGVPLLTLFVKRLVPDRFPKSVYFRALKEEKMTSDKQWGDFRTSASVASSAVNYVPLLSVFSSCVIVSLLLSLVSEARSYEGAAVHNPSNYTACSSTNLLPIFF
jgi:hypothetical protein